MKYLRLLLGLPLIYFYCAFSGAAFTSCTKKVIDTIYVPHDSTIYIHDTTTVKDSIYDLTSGLVAYYNFNGGNLNDSSGFNNNIVFNNATPTTDRNGVANNAYLFNGTSSYMTVANSESLNPNGITLYAILKVNGWYAGEDHGNFILCKDYDLANGAYILQFDCYDVTNAFAPPDTAREAFVGGYGDDLNTTNAAATADTSIYVHSGIWYKLAYTYDGLAGRLYINGNLVSSVTRTVPFDANTGDLYIGTNADPSGIFPFWFNGAIDEIRIYNRALSSPEITHLVNLP